MFDQCVFEAALEHNGEHKKTIEPTLLIHSCYVPYLGLGKGVLIRSSVLADQSLFTSSDVVLKFYVHLMTLIVP